MSVCMHMSVCLCLLRISFFEVLKDLEMDFGEGEELSNEEFSNQKQQQQLEVNEDAPAFDLERMKREERGMAEGEEEERRMKEAEENSLKEKEMRLLKEEEERRLKEEQERRLKEEQRLKMEEDRMLKEVEQRRKEDDE